MSARPKSPNELLDILIRTGITDEQLTIVCELIAESGYRGLVGASRAGMDVAVLPVKVGAAFIYSRPRPRAWEALSLAVFERDGWTCTYCCARDVPLHCDHVVPISRGGSNDEDNLTTACGPCNLSKGAKLVSEWRR